MLLFNHHCAPVHWPAPDDAKECGTLPELVDPPTLSEVSVATRSLANSKAPGASGPPAKALKALPLPVHAAAVLPLVHRFWPGDVASCHEWELATPKMLLRSKGSSKPLTSCRGVVLQGVFAQLASATATALEGTEREHKSWFVAVEWPAQCTIEFQKFSPARHCFEVIDVLRHCLRS